VANENSASIDCFYCEPLRAKGPSRKKLIAVLDYGNGVEYEGEAEPTRCTGDTLAIKAWNALNNGNGAIDWAGLETVCTYLGVEDVDGLISRLLTIKMHKTKD
jgi:hypothetical protein